MRKNFTGIGIIYITMSCVMPSAVQVILLLLLLLLVHFDVLAALYDDCLFCRSQRHYGKNHLRVFQIGLSHFPLHLVMYKCSESVVCASENYSICTCSLISHCPTPTAVLSLCLSVTLSVCHSVCLSVCLS